MDYEVEVSVSGDEILKEVFDILSPENATALNLVGITGTLEFIKNYHREFDSADKWKNLSLPTHGAGRRSSKFGNQVTEAWSAGAVSPERASIVNKMPLLSHKITGGTITPNKSKFLTIPMVPEAHGVRAGQYPNKLFIPKGKSYLAETDKSGEIRVVYLLRKSVTQKPVEGALPDDEALLEPFVEEALEWVDNKFNNL